MPVRTLVHPTTGQIVKTGCNPPPHPPKLRFAEFLEAGVPEKLLWSPATFDFSKEAAPSLLQMYLNDTYGDCVPAGQAHSDGVFTGNADSGSPAIFTDAQIKYIYTGMSGGVFNPADPSTDQGCDPQTALTWQMKNGLLPDGSHKLAGFAGINAGDPLEVRTGMWLEGLGLALDLPDEWITPFPSASGFVWDVAGSPNPQNGHWVVGVGAPTPAGIKIATWGMTGTMTYAAIAKYCMPATDGMLYLSISRDQIIRGTRKAANWVKWPKLMQAFESMGG
jgi:hypothetical protein